MGTIILGELIRQKIIERKMTVTKFARSIGCCRRNVYSIFGRRSLDTVQLRKISDVLEHNFFADC
ncbi:MAG: helix-turn-helix domain-containing protein [Dysgonamonadaceae bacterium]|jgi:plasmid maintenance system antidote protein VapI|nr:helix-turn-helix domain-containing protein [Dysgonamonadaceae bacterium]